MTGLGKEYRVLLYSIPAFILIIILIIGSLPEGEKKARTIEDTFDNNSYQWDALDKFVYHRHFSDGYYVFNVNNEGWCYWNLIPMNFPENCDIDLDSKWMEGETNSYGIGLHQSDSEYFYFSLRGDGKAGFGKNLKGNWVIDDTLQSNMGLAGQNQKNRQKIEIRGTNFTYYVNNHKVKTGQLDLEIKELAIHACGVQKIAFDKLNITNTTTGKLVYSENFNGPSDLWPEKRNTTCRSYFEGSRYLMELNNPDMCNWASSEKHQVTQDCEIELSSVWMNGDSSYYGFMIMEDDLNYITPELKMNGDARLVECIAGEYSFVQSQVKTGFISDGKVLNKQKLVIQKNIISYYVNDIPVITKPVSLAFPCTISLRTCGNQTVAFDNLKITYFE